ncbi:hypothetical protein OHB26_30830 [Nocardia sp. NBC_01503]|nr:hypothetical protein [Nocardia sp. NBC_01503]WTL31274.1 hypothetical protein OHB26_30830 [Nocardia sp. NBC_01503]
MWRAIAPTLANGVTLATESLPNPARRADALMAIVADGPLT